ncbi:hypothetical protein WMY93_026369 [Mugilogobius chulae]|uniref:B box-type domain-containing protein n=1 Tax=Mugilogobius chulae TaxID=88201 RepID=A0AAW0N1R9_9GOBI
MELLQKHLDQVLQQVQEKQNQAKSQAEALIQTLEKEIFELKQRSSEVEQLRSCKDYVQVLKNSSCVSTSSQHQRQVKKVFNEHLETVLAEAELQKVQKSAVKVTLDPDTAHPELSLSRDLKQVSYTGHWDTSPVCNCPLCKEIFNIRPQLKTNLFISAMVTQYRQRTAQRCVKQKKPPYVPRSGLVSGLCSSHNKPLQMFCQSDQALVCKVCAVFTHKNHRVVSIKEACDAKQRELSKATFDIHKMIQERLQKVQELQESLELINTAADEELIEGAQFFSTLIDFVQKSLDEILEEIQKKQNRAKSQAESLIQALEQEIFKLKQRSSEVEQLRNFKDYARTSFSLPWAVPTIVQQIQTKITEELQLFSKKQLTKLRAFAVDVTLDPNTAHPELQLSDDLKQRKDDSALCSPTS